jgi:hypothetical protein
MLELPGWLLSRSGTLPTLRILSVLAARDGLTALAASQAATLAPRAPWLSVFLKGASAPAACFMFSPFVLGWACGTGPDFRWRFALALAAVHGAQFALQQDIIARLQATRPVTQGPPTLPSVFVPALVQPWIARAAALVVAYPFEAAVLQCARSPSAPLQLFRGMPLTTFELLAGGVGVALGVAALAHLQRRCFETPARDNTAADRQ